MDKEAPQKEKGNVVLKKIKIVWRELKSETFYLHENYSKFSVVDLSCFADKRSFRNLLQNY